MRFLRRHHLLCYALLILLACRPGQAVAGLPKTDVITLISGDIITCEIKEMVRGKVQADTDYIGSISIKWDKVARLDSQYWFLVTLHGGSLVYGQFPDSGEDGVLTVGFQEKVTNVPMSQVVEIEPIRYAFWDRFDISVSLGVNWTKASDVFQSNFDASADYSGRIYSWGLNAYSMITDQGEGDVTRRNELSIYLQREITGKLNWTVDTGTYRNDELGVRFRVNLGGNLGYYFFRTNHLELSALGGANLNREWATQDSDPSNYAEGRVGTKFIIFYYDSPKTDLTVEMDLYPGISDTDRVRFEGNISGRQEIIKDLFVKLAYYESRDSKPPAGAASTADRGIVFSIEWTK